MGKEDLTKKARKRIKPRQETAPLTQKEGEHIEKDLAAAQILKGVKGRIDTGKKLREKLEGNLSLARAELFERTASVKIAEPEEVKAALEEVEAQQPTSLEKVETVDVAESVDTSDLPEEVKKLINGELQKIIDKTKLAKDLDVASFLKTEKELLKSNPIKYFSEKAINTEKRLKQIQGSKVLQELDERTAESLILKDRTENLQKILRALRERRDARLSSAKFNEMEPISRANTEKVLAAIAKAKTTQMARGEEVTPAPVPEVVVEEGSESKAIIEKARGTLKERALKLVEQRREETEENTGKSLFGKKYRVLITGAAAVLASVFSLHKLDKIFGSGTKIEDKKSSILAESAISAEDKTVIRERLEKAGVKINPRSFERTVPATSETSAEEPPKDETEIEEEEEDEGNERVFGSVTEARSKKMRAPEEHEEKLEPEPKIHGLPKPVLPVEPGEEERLEFTTEEETAPEDFILKPKAKKEPEKSGGEKLTRREREREEVLSKLKITKFTEEEEPEPEPVLQTEPIKVETLDEYRRRLDEGAVVPEVEVEQKPTEAEKIKGEIEKTMDNAEAEKVVEQESETINPFQNRENFIKFVCKDDLKRWNNLKILKAGYVIKHKITGKNDPTFEQLVRSLRGLSESTGKKPKIWFGRETVGEYVDRIFERKG